MSTDLNDVDVWLRTVNTGLQIAMDRVRDDLSTDGIAQYRRLSDAQDELVDLATESVGRGRRYSELLAERGAS